MTRLPSALDATLALLLAVCLAGCGRGGSPEWIYLARDVTWTRGETRAAITSADGRAFDVVDDARATWLETTIVRGDWTFRPKVMGGVWAAPVGVHSCGAPVNMGEVRTRKERLTSGDRSFRYARPPVTSISEWRFGSGSFATMGGRLHLRLDDGEEPPAESVLSVHTGRARRADGAWRISADRFSGEALSVWSGERLTSTVSIPADSTLRFATTIEPALYGRTLQKGPVRFRIDLDGESLFSFEVADSTAEHHAWHRLELPPEGRPNARLELFVEGAFAYSSVFAPVIGPASTGAYGDRPWGAGRADIIVFLADTFRADSLAVYGGELGITPNLDRLAERALVFERAWSTGTFTLPAHASMFAGVFPRQAGIAGAANRLPDEFETVAEILSRHGYRTGAVTDSVMVSARLGLGQGFEWFDERNDTLRSTIDRAQAFLDADDGRPVFLFVQSYRTHLPYRVSAATRRKYGEKLGIESDFATLRAKLSALLAVPGAMETAEADWTIDKLRSHYRGGVVDLDRGFASFQRGLEERGLMESGYLIFTSDHGEGFGEHAVFYHTGPVWDELGRIPLLIVGPGVRPEVRREAASLVDFSPTVADMAGVPASAGWLGRSWLSLDVDRPIYLFECQDDPGSTLAIVDGDHKLIGLEDPARIMEGHLLWAFDLGQDPGEMHDVLPTSAWPRELYGRLGPSAATLLEPIVGVQHAGLDPEKRAELQAMGYGGE